MADNSGPPASGSSPAPAPAPGPAPAPESADVLAAFRGLPLSELIAAPLSAASDAQTMLARSTVEFIDTVGLNPVPSGSVVPRTARELQFSVTRPVTAANGAIRDERVELSVPLLALVATPNLQVQSISVDFDMRIKSSMSVQESDRLAGRTDVSDPGGPDGGGAGDATAAPSVTTGGSAPGRTAPPASKPAATAAPPTPRPRIYLHGEVASSKEQTRQSDNSARMHVHVEAGQAPVPEGLSRIMDILATACAPRALVPAGSLGTAAPAGQLEPGTGVAQRAGGGGR